jgi:hypothetical protein
MSQFTLEELQTQRKTYWKELQTITLTLRGLEETLKEVRIQHKIALDNYSKTDHDLALIDGRMERVSEQANNETKGWRRRKTDKPPSVDDLTQEQIDELLLELDPESIKLVPVPNEIDQNDLIIDEDETDD